MSPERLLEIYRDVTHHDSNIERGAVRAIIAACTEERRTALTEAAEVCRVIAKHDYQMTDVLSIARGNRCDDCGDAIERLRDG